jgi:transcriptional regulator with XRE-family HTH domain
MLTALTFRYPSGREPALVPALRAWLSGWPGIGRIIVGMARQGFDLQLTRYGQEGWRATFYAAGREHSITAAVGSAWERMPWQAGAASGVGHVAPDGAGAVRRAGVDQAAGRAGLGRRIAEVRARLGLTQVAFAERIGVTRNTVRRYEQGEHHPRALVLARIAQLGDVPIDWLLGGPAGPDGRREETWEQAVRLLRAVWPDPRRRSQAVTALRKLSACR